MKPTEQPFDLPEWCPQGFRNVDEVKQISVKSRAQLRKGIEQLMLAAIEDPDFNTYHFRLTLISKPIE